MGLNVTLQFHQMSKADKVRFYINNMNQVLNQDALFSDGTSEYRIPPEPQPFENVKIRFRTARDNVDMVYLVTNTERYEMTKVYDDRLFDYYEAEISLTEQRVDYYF